MRLGPLKVEKRSPIRPNDGIASSDYTNTSPYVWKYLEGPPIMAYLMSHEYERLWKKELEVWEKRLYPKKVTSRGNRVLEYVANFKSTHKPKKPPEPKKPFKMKRFEGIQSKVKTTDRQKKQAIPALIIL